MTKGYIDTHCHLDSKHFEKDSVEVARRSMAAGVRMLTVAANVESACRCLLLAEECPGVRAAVGVHPNEAAAMDDVSWTEIEYLSQKPRVVAVGETGLDYYWKDTPPDVQKHWFQKHLELALAIGKPISIHARDSVQDMLAMVEPYLKDGLRAVWHCFVAGKKEIGPALDFAVANGMYLAIGGLVTFEDQKPLREHVAQIPDELLLLETDAPYLTPRPKTVDRNEPTGVIRVAEVLAELRGADPETIREITTGNAEELFGFE